MFAADAKSLPKEYTSLEPSAMESEVTMEVFRYLHVIKKILKLKIF